MPNLQVGEYLDLILPYIQEVWRGTLKQGDEKI